MWNRTGDPASDWAAYNRDLDRQVKNLPRCCLCDGYVFEYGYRFSKLGHVSDAWICRDCMEYAKESTED